MAIDAARTAMVVVDMQNAFASMGGMFDLAGIDISGATPAIEANKRLLAAARKSGVTVVYLQMSYRADLSDGGDTSSPNHHKELGLVMMRERPELRGKLLIDGSWDWQIVDALKPAPGDHVIRKSRYSGFCNTGLEAFLRARSIRHLLFTGVATNICVDATARDAYSREFWPILVEDAMNHSGPDFNRQSTLWNFENALGWVTSTDMVVDALRIEVAETLPT
ncbi:isochorismatase family cysteine hydrolase [Mesorhizobium sp. B2-3-4]|uniref:cysteine hydrolase family protein n=1 Tax=Mesorhizobium sp. B2-3-4 TaxID=2589959 RepID=UPI001FEE3237|nr:isochorismatase family cysteine hydrolase [Mesorhizobium sp. B2-3-4]